MAGSVLGGKKANETNRTNYPYHIFLEDGRVYSIKQKKFVKPQKDKDGYAICGVTRSDGKRICVRIHRRVAEQYIPNHDGKPFVNHKDGNKFNNDISNLEWVTAKENTAHAVSMGLIGYTGEENANSKLTNDEVYRIRELYETGLLKQAEIAKAFDISQRLVSLIIRKENWKHL